MANFYLDVSAIGHEYQAYAYAMTWGAGATDKPLPQDGNGVAGPGHSAAVAVAEILINAQPADTNTLVIAGATITAKTTVAAKNQFAIGASVAATVTNIVSLINTFGTANNQCDATMPTTVSALALPLSYWCYARVKPGTTDTIQIATRIAGADLNYHVTLRTYMLISHAGWGTAPTFTQFAGGADGPFAYWCNNTAVFGKAQFAYGVFTAKPSSVLAPGITDLILMRTARSGSNLTVSLSATTAITLTAIEEMNFVADDGTTWTGDNGQLTIAVSNTSGAVASTIRPKDGAWNIRRHLRFIARAADGLQFTYTATTTGSTLLVGGNERASNIVIRKTKFLESNANGKIYLFQISGLSAINALASDCNIYLKSDHPVTAIASNSGTGKAKFVGCYFNFSSVSSDPTSIVAFTGDCQQSNEIEFRHCKAEVSGGAWKVGNAVSGTTLLEGRYFKIICDDMSGLRVASFPWNAAYATAVTFSMTASCFWQSRDGDKPFRYSTPLITTDWIDDGTYPTAGEVLPSGNEWSVRSVWQTGVHMAEPQVAFTAYSFYRGATGSKVLTLELLTPVSGAPAKADVEVIFSYTDSSGVIRNESSGAPFEHSVADTGTALTASSKSWTLNGLTGYEARKIEITTAYALGTSTEISAALMFLGATATDIPIFINPTVGVA